MTGTDESELLREVEAALGVAFPADYREFIVGGAQVERDVGGSYLALYGLDDIVSRNRAYEMAESHPGLVLIGSDGGGEGVGFDFRDSPPRIVVVNFVSADWDDAVVQADSFTEFIARFRSGKGYKFETEATRASEWAAIAQISASIVEGHIHPARGASQVWWTRVDLSEPLSAQVEMLQLCDAWEQSAGDAALDIEREIVEYAHVLIVESRRRLGG